VDAREIERIVRSLEARMGDAESRLSIIPYPGPINLLRRFLDGTPDIGSVFQRKTSVEGAAPEYEWRGSGTGISGELLPHTAKLIFDTTPANGDVRMFHWFPNASELVTCRHRTISGTIDFNLELRAFANWNTVAGTEVFASDKTIDSTETEETVFATGSIPAGTLLCVVFSGAASPASAGIILEWMENV
jgi:hypothetical protein